MLKVSREEHIDRLEKLIRSIQQLFSYEDQQYVRVQGNQHRYEDDISLARIVLNNNKTSYAARDVFFKKDPDELAFHEKDHVGSDLSFQFGLANKLAPQFKNVIHSWVGLPITVRAQTLHLPETHRNKPYEYGTFELHTEWNDNIVFTQEQADRFISEWENKLPHSQDVRASYASIQDMLTDNNINLDWVQGSYTRDGFTFQTDCDLSKKDIQAIQDAFADCNVIIQKGITFSEHGHPHEVLHVEATFPDRVKEKVQTPYTELGFSLLSIPKPPTHLKALVNLEQINRMNASQGLHFDVYSHVHVENVKGNPLDDYIGVRVVMHAAPWYYFSPYPLKHKEFDIDDLKKKQLSRIHGGLDTHHKWCAFFDNAYNQENRRSNDNVPATMVQRLYTEALAQDKDIKKGANSDYLKVKDLDKLGWRHNITKDPTFCMENTEGDMVWMPRKDFQSWLEKTLVVLYELESRGLLGPVTVAKDNQPINEWNQLVDVCNSKNFSVTQHTQGYRP